MTNAHFHKQRTSLLILCALLAASLLPLAQRTPSAQAAPATISGTAYQDYNGNGRMDDATSAAINNQGATAAIDSGVAGIVVRAYDANNQQVGPDVTTNANGAYTLAGVDTTQPYRVEFSGFKERGYESGANQNTSNPSAATSGTSIQFAMGGATNVDFGVNTPADFCQNNPNIVVNCVGPFDQTMGPQKNRTTMYLSAYGNGSTDTNVDQSVYTTSYDTPAPTPVVHAYDIGTTIGLAYNRQAARIYTAAYMKRHAGFGPGVDQIANSADDAGTVYIIDPNAANKVVGGIVVPGATTNPHDTSNPTTITGYYYDGMTAGNVGPVWDAVGKLSLGGVTTSDDGTQLFVMNLENRTLYAYDLAISGANAGLPLASTPARWQTVPGVTAIAGSAPVGSAPLTVAPSTCPENDIRPFATTYQAGMLYIGMVCSAQSSQMKANLKAYVYQVNPATLAFSANPVFTFALDYQRGIANPGAPFNSPAAWNPWTGQYINVAAPDASHNFVYPQPILTDIAFDRGNLIIGLRDRAADQGGNGTPTDPNDIGTNYRAIAAGDTLRACGSLVAGWTLESNGQCDGTGSSAALQSQFSSVGPGTTATGGEFYYRDEYGYNGTFVSNTNVANYTNTTRNHDEVSAGTMAQVPGFPDVVAAVYDPITIRPPSVFNDGGLRWWSNTNGDLKKIYRIYPGAGDLTSSNPTFGKANGIGDVIILCDTAPVEIGNRVWRDDNRNGVQDAGEPPMAGVTLHLYAPGAVLGSATPLASAVTDANGNYLFSDDMRGYAASGNNGALDGGFTQNGQGGAISTASARYGVLGLTPNTRGFQIQIDTTQPALSNFTLTKPNADASANGDSRDSDAIPNGTNAIIPVNVSSAGHNNHTFDAGFFADYSLGNRVWFDTNNNGLLDPSEQGVSNVRVNLFAADANGQPIGAQLAMVTTDTTGHYRFDDLFAGDYLVQIDATNFVKGAPLYDYLSSTPTQADPNTDIDSDDNGIDNPTPTSGGITSGVVTLGPAGMFNEPINEVDDPARYGSGSTTGAAAADDHTNLTVDFGFYKMGPTAITMLRMSATRDQSDVIVRWTTSSEQRTFGFRVYRSATGQRADASEATPALIPATGSAGGASYTWRDTRAVSGIAYTYWVVEIGGDGQAEYGPLRITATPAVNVRLFLPLTLGS